MWPDIQWLIGMVWDGHLFMNTVLPFGLRCAPILFNMVVEALAFIIRSRWLKHYLDDFVLVGPPASYDCRLSGGGGTPATPSLSGTLF